jgi:hypothetical protein
MCYLAGCGSMTLPSWTNSDDWLEIGLRRRRSNPGNVGYPVIQEQQRARRDCAAQQQPVGSVIAFCRELKAGAAA